MLILCDFERLGTPEAVYDYLTRELAFPAYFGRNLDALHDCLTDITDETEIEIRNADELSESLGSYGAAAIHVIEDSAEENKHIEIL